MIEELNKNLEILELERIKEILKHYPLGKSRILLKVIFWVGVKGWIKR